MQGSRQVTGWRHQDRSSCARRRSCPLPDPEPVRPSGGRRSVSNESMIGRTGNTMQMRSFTDIFIKHPVLAIVVNLMIVLAGWRALTTLPVQQYPKIESSSVIITAVYYGASAETVRGFLSTPIERVVSAIGGVDYVESTSRAGVSTVTVHLKLNHSSTAALAEVTARLQQVRSELPPEAEPPVIELQRADRPYASFNLSPGDVQNALRRNNYLAAVGRTKGNFAQINLLANTDLRSAAEFEEL